MATKTTDLEPGAIDRIGAELDALRRRVAADLGAADADYIHNVVAVQRLSEAGGRVLLFAGWFPPAWLGGVAALALSKILDNMEIGHNVMHGQYDWMKDPALNSRTFEWDMVCPGGQWRRSHNFTHHTYTNILGKDRDVGYGILRITEDQPWHPYYLGNPLYAAAQAVFFEYGIMLHDLEMDRIVQGKRGWADVRPLLGPMLRKTARQAGRDYVLHPVLTGPLAPLTLTANITANLVRNLWAFAIIFCGHFPDGTEVFTEEQSQDESRGQWYVRQLLGSANIDGSPLFHVLSGNLGHQIEHHLFPDLPSHRYSRIAPEVRAICERHDLPYHTGSLSRQLGSVVRKIFRLALPRWR
ncbi:linoleoyl-CoA desaturase [Amycolatopsis lexingtonensis]|uniref:Linoleoyl-CoA desaturase n=1 Tax=Amycolatopsis lexingtonensis TaxID=218822 RepID=A0ABR9I4M6_9PSEU|nr:acyl-CoA desaturase [Amycolatopsis lexingtonensis]MBE1498178.1 linoleoyl-CoA desaturase [Amycolatopsis lexingtonensis]